MDYRNGLPKWTTVNSRLADTSLLRTPRYYGQQLNLRRKLQTFDWNKLPLLRTLGITDLRTLDSVPTSQFYCFLSRYSGHRAESWNICTHIKSIFSAFLIHRGEFKVSNEFSLLGDKVGEVAIQRRSIQSRLERYFKTMWSLMQSIADLQVFPWKFFRNVDYCHSVR